MMNNKSSSGVFLLFLFSILLVVQMADSKQLLNRSADGSGNGKAVLECTSFIDHKEGETCFSITQKFKLTMDEFLSINPNLNCDKLFVGEWLCLTATT